MEGGPSEPRAPPPPLLHVLIYQIMIKITCHVTAASTQTPFWTRGVRARAFLLLHNKTPFTFLLILRVSTRPREAQAPENKTWGLIRVAWTRSPIRRARDHQHTRLFHLKCHKLLGWVWFGLCCALLPSSAPLQRRRKSSGFLGL